MKTSRLFIIFIISFFVGIIFAQFFPWLLFLFIGLCFLAFVVFNLFQKQICLLFNFKFKQHLRKIFLLIVIGLLVGIFRYFLAVAVFGPSNIGYYRDLGISLKIEGLIDREVDARSDRQYVVLQSKNIFYQSRWFPVKGEILIKAQRYPEFSYGDFLQVICSLRAPPVFEKFSYADYLAKDDIFVVCYKPQIFLQGKEKGNSFWNTIFWFKSKFSEQINALFSEPEASLVAGLLFGLRRNIPADILDDFNRAGLTHVLAISGYNITLMITIFGSLFKKSSRKIRFVGILGGIVLFLLLTGFSSSVIRAAWMGFFTISATLLGRKTNGLLVLFLSAFVMVFLNPRILLSDLSFELSFTATLGLILCMPFFEKYSEKYFSKWPAFLKEGLCVTLAAQVFTTPIIIYYFGRISLIAPLANILFLPLVPFIMFFAFVALMISFVLWPLANLFVWIAWILLKILLIGVHLIAYVPGASLEI